MDILNALKRFIRGCIPVGIVWYACKHMSHDHVIIYKEFANNKKYYSSIYFIDSGRFVGNIPSIIAEEKLKSMKKCVEKYEYQIKKQKELDSNITDITDDDYDDYDDDYDRYIY